MPGTSAPDDGNPVGTSSSFLGLPTVLLLAALAIFAIFVALDPLLSFFAFGSDTGEYYRLTGMLVANGHLPIGGANTGGYTGWGFAYPDFPGLFVLAGSVSGALNTGTFPALTLAVPALSALSVLPLFLLFRRLWPQDSVALLGAAFAAVLMPRLFSIAHPAPLAPGDLLAVGALWMFVESRADARWYAPMAVTGAALIATHHLSSYFFLLMALGAMLLLELVRPQSWSARFPWRELAFLYVFAAGMLLFWFEAAPDFRPVLTGGLPPAFATTPVPLLAVTAAAFLLVGVLLRWRRSRSTPRPFRVRYPSDGSVLRDLLLAWGGVSGGLALLLVVPLPGTSQVLTPSTLLWFSPLFAFVGFAAGSRRLVSGTLGGPFLLTWLAALGFSAAALLAAGSLVLPPARHPEYLVIPLALLVAIGLARWWIRAEGLGGRRAAAAAGLGILVLLSANAVIAFPPPSDFGGFQEGYTPGDAALWMWSGSALPPGTAVATDHRLSSMIFGVTGDPATWQSTPALFVGTNRSDALAELRSSPAPHGPYAYPISAVAIDATMRSGVALDPNALAHPLSAQALAWFGGAPFVPIYENGNEIVYWVDVAGIPAGNGT